MEVWIASSNAKKALELERSLPSAVRVRSIGEVDADFDVVEDEPDFASNARKKARAAVEFLREHAARLPEPPGQAAVVLADDSGLCVDALGGRPGVHSARWAGPDADDGDRIAKLLDELAAAGAARPEQRSAHFVCYLVALRLDGGEFFEFEGRCDGEILDAPLGQGGFGYDPVFAVDSGRSFGTLSPPEKDLISHRGRALRALSERIRAELAG